jgi:hypothetical protein
MKLVELDIFESVPVDKHASVSDTVGAADDEEYGAHSRKVRLESVRKEVSIIELLDMLDHSFVLSACANIGAPLHVARQLRCNCSEMRFRAG